MGSNGFDYKKHDFSPSSEGADFQASLAATFLRQGLASVAAGGHKAALRQFAESIRLQPAQPQAFVCLGEALLGTGDWPRALQAFSRALALRPDSAVAQLGLGEALGRLGRFGEAMAVFDGLLPAVDGLDRDVALRLWLQRGMACGAAGQVEEALRCFAEAIALAPDCAEAYFGRGNGLRAQGQFPAALAAFEQALVLNPQFLPAQVVKGFVLGELQQFDAALAVFRGVLEQAKVADAYYGIGQVMESMGNFVEAGRQYTHALSCDEGHGPSLFGMINCLNATKQYELALDHVEKLEKLKRELPATRFLPSVRLFAERLLCRWEGQEERLAALAAAVGEGRDVVDPFCTLLWFDDPLIHRQAAATFLVRYRKTAQEAALPRLQPVWQAGEKIRIGYFSSDFQAHATAYLMAGLFEHHDRSRFEIVAFSFGGEATDAMRQRLMAGCDDFVDVTLLSERDIALLSRERGIHIALDLKGVTQGCRPGIFAYGAAPLQVSWLGYPGTLAAAQYDYLVADGVIMAGALRQEVSEAVIEMPHTYQVNDDRRGIALHVPSRAECGLPSHGFVFCCFNNHFKITPEVFDAWLRVMAAVPGSVLWMLEGSPTAHQNLRARAAGAGIEPARLVFAPHVPLEQHLARLQLADLSLETLPYNAHTTASDALWAGVPHLTCQGRSFAARVGSSLLMAIDLPELITTSLAEFEALAIALATDLERLATIRRKLDQNRLAQPLFDTEGFTRDLESAYEAIWARYQLGLAPEDIRYQPKVSVPENVA